jgi:hypothetical protein
MTSRTITYHFAFTDGSSWKYELEFDRDFRFINTNGAPAKPWTALDFNQCPHCPLNKVTTPQCPVARNLDQIVEDSKNTISYTPATVSVITAERTYVKKCATQEGLRSLFGMIMGASGCPHLDWFRPMARFHLPFSDSEETLFRVLSLQLLIKFFEDERGDIGQCAEQIQARYDAVQKVNHAFIKRIRSYCDADADKNALAALDMYSQLFQFQQAVRFESIQGYFKQEKHG